MTDWQDPGHYVDGVTFEKADGTRSYGPHAQWEADRAGVARPERIPMTSDSGTVNVPRREGESVWKWLWRSFWETAKRS